MCLRQKNSQPCGRSGRGPLLWVATWPRPGNGGHLNCNENGSANRSVSPVFSGVPLPNTSLNHIIIHLKYIAIHSSPHKILLNIKLASYISNRSEVVFIKRPYLWLSIYVHFKFILILREHISCSFANVLRIWWYSLPFFC